LKKLLVEQGRAEEAVVHLRALAEQAQARGELDALEDTLREILQYQPENRDVRLELVELYEQSDQPDKAVVELIEMAHRHAEAGEAERALELTKRAAARQPENPTTLNELKNAYLAAGQKPQALETLFRAFDIYVALKKRQSAEKTLRDVLVIEPNNAMAKEKVIELFRLGAPLEEQIAELLASAEDALSSGHRAAAVEALSHVLELDPEQPEALARLKVIYAGPAVRPLGEEEQAEARLFEDVDVAPKGEMPAEEEINIDWGEPGELESAVSGGAASVEQAVEVDVFGEAPEQVVEEIDVFGDITPRRAPAKEEKRAPEPIELSEFEEPVEVTAAEALPPEPPAAGEIEPEPFEAGKIEIEPEPGVSEPRREERKPAFESVEISSEDFLREEAKATAIPPYQPPKTAEGASRIIEEFRKPEIEVIGKGKGVADLLDELHLEGVAKPAERAKPGAEPTDLFDEIFGAKPKAKAAEAPADLAEDLFTRLEAEEKAKPAETKDDIFQSFVANLDQEMVTAKDARTHFDLGIAFREMDSIEEAINEFEKALAVDSGEMTFDINYQLGQCYASLNKYEMAVDYLESALSEGNDSEPALFDLLFELGVVYKQMGNFERAKHYFVEVDKKSSNYRGAKAEIAEVDKGKGKKGKKKGSPDDDNIGFL
jgi:tetratricopeptide (TPR) repeat protein